MTTALTILAIICILGLPIPIVYLTRKNKILGAIGAIACCYIVGFIFSTLGLTGISYDKGLTTTITYVLVALSIPLILFSIDLRSVKKLTKGTIVGYSLCIVSVIAIAFAIFFITYKFFPSTELSAMIVGLYTGGTPNMNAIGAAMGAESNVLSAANVADTIIGGIYFLLLISIAPKFYRLVLNRRNKKEYLKENNEKETTHENIEEEKKDDFTFGFKDKKSILRLLGSFALAIGCVGVGVLLELIFENTVGENLLYILLSVSVLGVAFSFIKPIREIKGQYTLGMYLILMFSLALSMSIDWSVFLTDILPTFAFFACAQISVIILHIILCKIFGVDGDTAIITSTAGVYGPPFIAPVAKAAGRQDLIAPGVICGALGLAIGTLLGIGIGQLFLLFI
ncbi:MAG: DUF819 family protein [Erysipelotrichales bacterium]|nr:DUF819 family protein [Erysipelotrichales bacterium]